MDQQFVYLVEWNEIVALNAVKVWFISSLVLAILLPLRWASLVAFVKVAMVLAYFCFFADGNWFYGGDDYLYYEKGMELLETGANPIMIFWEPVTHWYFFARTGFAFMVYYNYLALYFLEARYYAPVLGLVVISSMTVVLLAASFRENKKNELYVKCMAVFLALHWYSLAWNSFLNLKDPLVGLAMSLGIFALVEFRRKPLLAGSVFIALMYSFHWLRFYFPIFFGAAIMCTRAVISNWKTRLLLSVILLPVAMYLMRSQLNLAIRMGDWTNIFYGIPHFLLQPAPWKITEPATYLTIPSMIHWLMTLPAMIGGMLLFRRNISGEIIVTMVVAAACFYGVVSAIASTRHRYPIDILIAIMQFHFLWWTVRFWINDSVVSDQVQTSGK